MKEKNLMTINFGDSYTVVELTSGYVVLENSARNRITLQLNDSLVFNKS